MMLKKLLAGGLIADLSYVMATNVYANAVIPTASNVSTETTEILQILAGICGILICFSRVIKTVAEAYLIKRKADLLEPGDEEDDRD